MDERVEHSPLERFCTVLAEHGVEFIVIGGQAEALMGSSRVTYDAISVTDALPTTSSAWRRPWRP